MCVQVNVLLNNCKKTIASLSRLVGTTIQCSGLLKSFFFFLLYVPGPGITMPP